MHISPFAQSSKMGTVTKGFDAKLANFKNNKFSYREQIIR